MVSAFDIFFFLKQNKQYGPKLHKKNHPNSEDKYNWLITRIATSHQFYLFIKFFGPNSTNLFWTILGHQLDGFLTSSFWLHNFLIELIMLQPSCANEGIAFNLHVHTHGKHVYLHNNYPNPFGQNKK